MRYDRWKDVIELTGIVAIVASLVFVGLQLRQDDRTARLELFDRAEEQMRGLNGLISEHADVWLRGCSGADMSEEDEIIFVEVYNAYVNHTYLRWMRFTITDVTTTDGQYLIDAFAANIHRYPGMRAAWDDRVEWVAEGRRFRDPFSEEFFAGIEIRLAELARMDPNPEWGVKYCGI